MRILEAFGEPISYGGQEAFVMNALPHIDSSDMTIDLLSPYYCDNNSTVQKVRERGGEVYALNCRFSPGNVRSSEAAPIRKFLCTHHYDVIHIHSGSNSMLSMYALSFTRTAPANTAGSILPAKLLHRSVSAVILTNTARAHRRQVNGGFRQISAGIVL